MKIVEIPVHDHLIRFAQKELWHDQDPPFRVEEDSLLGKYVFSLWLDFRQQDLATVESNTLLSLEFSDSLAKRKITPRMLSKINSFLEHQFKAALAIWVKAQMDFGNNRYQAVLSFLRFYGCASEANIDRYYQYLQRARKLPYRYDKKKSEKNQLEKD